MEDWELDFEWLKVRHLVKNALNRDVLPDMNAILFLIGVQELGRWNPKFTKEEKQDLMHIAVCNLMSYDGYYEFKGRDADGWPHYDTVKPFVQKGVKEQEEYLKTKVIQYFKEWKAANGVEDDNLVPSLN
ncbi:MAG: hypothetical protein IT258_03745 [Saprospiraceae bacterium]|nr:hypothetical protein [Saprospiraceae bacterium]